jgi:hypothetical protein
MVWATLTANMSNAMDEEIDDIDRLLIEFETIGG